MKIVLKQLGKWILRHILRKGAEEVIEHLEENRQASAKPISAAQAIKQKQRNLRRRKRKAAKKIVTGGA